MSSLSFGDMSFEELSRMASSLRQEMLNLRLQQRVGRLENPSRMKLARRELARCLTVLSKHKSVPRSN